MSLCVLAGAKLTVLALTTFTLSWTHSVERTAWQEDWRITPRGLEIVEARIKGSGAGVEPPEGALLKDGWWRYRPALPPLEEVALGASGATESVWRICSEGRCTLLDEAEGGGRAITLRPCAPGSSSRFTQGGG